MDKTPCKTTIRPIILVLMLVSFFNVNAQFKAGDFMLGGSLSFNRQKGQLPSEPTQGTETKSFFRLAPRVGVFISKRWEAGFFTMVEYNGESSNLLLQDSTGKNFTIPSRKFQLDFEFGFYAKYYLPIRDRLYWANSIRPSWGTAATGDQLAGLFESGRPQQNRESFFAANWITELQYFIKPTLSVSFGIAPLSYRYTYNTVQRDNFSSTKERSHKVKISNIATGLFIGFNLLIVSEDEE